MPQYATSMRESVFWCGVRRCRTEALARRLRRARSEEVEDGDIGIKKDRIRCFEYDPLYGDNGIRTRDLCVANATLSQLSYVPATAVYYSADKAETELIFSDFAFPFFRFCQAILRIS